MRYGSVTRATVYGEPMKYSSISCIGILALLGLASAFAADMLYAGQQTRAIKALLAAAISRSLA